MEHPYKNISELEGTLIREFSQETDPLDLKWHRDLKNREIQSLDETDWMIQLENELPVSISNHLIPAREWHRLIKGTGKLVLKIKEW